MFTGDLIHRLYVRPSDTPYTGGVYEFDIFLPIKHPGYPSLPPKVNPPPLRFLCFIIFLLRWNSGRQVEGRWGSIQTFTRTARFVSPCWGPGLELRGSSGANRSLPSYRSGWGRVWRSFTEGMFRFSYLYKVLFWSLNPTTMNPGSLKPNTTVRRINFN